MKERYHFKQFGSNIAIHNRRETENTTKLKIIFRIRTYSDSYRPKTTGAIAKFLCDKQQISETK